MKKNIRICTVCVMDDGAAPLEFDEKGQCNCCREALARQPHEYFPNARGQEKLEALVLRLKNEGRGRPYDCMMGLSGGIDSAYLAHLMRTRYDLRLLAVHVDAGWNSEAAVSNIERIVRKLDIDLHTEVIEWGEIRDLQVSFLKAGVLNQDMPQDHAFFATLYKLAPQMGIRTFLSGVNFSTECVISPGWGHPSMDGKHIQAIHARHGSVPLRSYPVMTIKEYLWQTRAQRQLTIDKPLNYVSFSKSNAKDVLKHAYGWKDYGTKHAESRFTKFYQEIYLPRKLGFDKRSLHLSSLIVSRQVTREEALEDLRQPIISDRNERLDIRFVAKKLQVTEQSLRDWIEAPLTPHTSYPTDLGLLQAIHKVRGLVRRVWGSNRRSTVPS